MDKTMFQDPDLETMISAKELERRIGELGQQISADYQDKELTVIGVLNGCFLFFADLVRQIDLPIVCDFLGLSSYGSATKSSGVVAITKDLNLPIKDRHILIVEDIIDTGLTMSYLLRNLRTRGPSSIKICSLLSKPERREIDVNIDYLGFTIEDQFVVGYGLDFDGRYRNLPYIGIKTGVK